MISVMVAKWVGDAFGEEGIYGIWIAMRRYPWLAPVEYKDKGEVAGEVMIPVDNLVVVRSGVDKLSHLGESPSCAACLEFIHLLSWAGFSRKASLVKTWEYDGFPVIGGDKLLGFIGREKLVAFIGNSTPLNYYTLY